MNTNRQWLLAQRPQGMVGKDNFTYAEQPIPEPGDGQVLVRNLYLSFDPTQRGWMEDRESYLPPVALGEPMRAGSIGQVVESHHAEFAAGDIVQTTGGWQDFVVAAPGQGPMGLSVGIAGGPEKCAWLKDEAGFDDVIDYKNEDVNARISQTCPNKLDVYFDNVGGDILEAALNHLNLKARIVMCGGTSGYNATQPIPGPSNLMNIVTTRSRREGFIILDYMARAPEAIKELSGWVGSGDLKYQVDVQEGFDNIPDTLQRLFTGKNLGKQLLKIADPS